MIIFGITTKLNKDKVNKKLLRVAKVIKAIRRETNKNPTHVYQGKDFLQKYMSESGRKKADTKHPPALVPTVVGDGYLNVSHFLQVLQTDSLTAFALAIFKNTCVVNSLGKERLFLPLEQREILLANFFPTIK